jgi:site-specific recombinase XerD
MSGHSSLKTTQIYANVIDAKLKTAMEKVKARK